MDENTIHVVQNPLEFEEGINDLLAGQDDEVAAKVRALFPGIVAHVARIAEARRARAFAAEFEIIKSTNEKEIKRMMDEYRKAQEPPTTEEIAKLVSQEYVEFPMKLVGVTDNSTVTFVIREVPLSKEKKILKILGSVMQELMPALKQVDFAAGASVADQIERLVTLMPQFLDTLAELAAECIKPAQTELVITKEWVFDNMSITRIMGVINAQLLANRYRDFFSLASRSLLPGMTR